MNKIWFASEAESPWPIDKDFNLHTWLLDGPIKDINSFDVSGSRKIWLLQKIYGGGGVISVCS